MAGYIETCYDFIRKASKEGRLVLFVGAGVSKNSGLPTWWELIREMAIDMGYEDYNNLTTDQYLYIPQIYYNERGKIEYIKRVKEILDIDAEPNPIHRKIFGLKPNHIITTNYDTLLEKEMAKPETEVEYSIIRKNTDAAHCNHSNLLIKMHGDFKDNNFVLKEDDYLSYARNFQLVETVVKSIFATNLIVFVGFSAVDPNFKLIYQWVKDILLHDCQPTYLLESETEIPRSQFNYFRSQGIHIVPYDDGTIKKIINSNSENYKHRDSITDARGQKIYEHFLAIQNLPTSPKSIFEVSTLKQIINLTHNVISTFATIPALSISDILTAIDPQGIHLSGQYNELHIHDEKTGSIITENRKFSIIKPLSKKIRDIFQAFQKAGIKEVTAPNLTIKTSRTPPASSIDNERTDPSGFVHYERQANSFLESDQQTQSFFERLRYGRILALIGRVKEANKVFKEVAIDSLAVNDVLSWYFSQYNRRSLARILWANLLAYRGMNAEEIFEIRDSSQYLSIQSHPDFSSKLSSLNNNPVLSQFINLIEYSQHIHYARGHLTDTLKQAREILYQSLKGTGRTLHNPSVTDKSLFYIMNLLSFTERNGILFDFLPEFRETCRLYVSTIFALVSSPRSNDDIWHRTREVTTLDSFAIHLAIYDMSTKDLLDILEDYQLESKDFSIESLDYITRSIEDLVQYTCDYISDDRLFFYHSYVSNCLLISKFAKLSLEQNNRILRSILKFLSNDQVEHTRDIFRYLSDWIQTLNPGYVSNEIALEFIKFAIARWWSKFYHCNSMLTHLVSMIDTLQFRPQVQEIFKSILAQFEIWQDFNTAQKITLANDILIPCLPLFSQKDQRPLMSFLKKIFKEEWEPETADIFFELIYRTDYTPTQVELSCYFSFFLDHLSKEELSDRNFEIASAISAQIVLLLREKKITLSKIPTISTEDLKKVSLLFVVIHPLAYDMAHFNISWLSILPLQTIRKLAADTKCRQAIIRNAKQSSNLPEEFFKYFTKAS